MTTWRRLTIYCISFFAVFFIGIAIDLACGPEPDPYDYYVTFFHNNLQKSDGYRPFYFSGYTFFNGDTYQVENVNRAAEADINVKEWMTYLGNSVTYKDVSRILYESGRKTDSLYFWNYPSRRFPDSIKQNSFIKKLVKKKEAMAYVMLAKKTEPLVNPSGDDEWKVSLSSKDKEHVFALKYIKMGVDLNDKFLRLRCFYQAQRLLHYGGYTEEAASVYDEHIKKVSSWSHVKGWALNLKAGEEDKFGHREQAAYLYSKVFAICPERRVRVYCDFLRMNVPIAQVIKLTRNNHEKAFVYAIKGFRNPRIGLNTLKKVYDTDPGSEVLSVLLAREINKVEEHYLTPKFNGGNYYDSIGFWGHDKYDSVKSYYINYIPKLKKFCDQLATEHRYPEPALGYLGSAYLSWITGDTEAGLATLSRINNIGIRSKLNDEKQLIKLLLLSQSIKRIDTAAENELLPSLTWLEKKVKQERSLVITGSRYWSDYAMKYYSASSRDFYEKVLAPLYFKQKDTAMAALCILKSEKTILRSEIWEYDLGLGFDMPFFWQTSMHSYQLKKILNWDHSLKRRSYLKLLMAEFHQSTVSKTFGIGNAPAYQLKTTITPPEQKIIPAIYDLLGTAYLREHKYSQAVNAFKKIGAKKLSHLPIDVDNPSRYPNPFADQLHDYPWAYQGAIDNKLTFAMVMAKLQRQIKSHKENAAAYYYKMATGLYNTSWYGSAWYYKAYSWANADIDAKAKVFYYNDDYLKEKGAEKYFLKARSLSNDNEFRAKCTFMAAKCKQKQMQFPDEYPAYLTGKKYDLDESNSATKKYDRSLRQNPYFKTLQKDYSKTAFFKLAVSECSYLRDFLHPIEPKKPVKLKVVVVGK